jgi:nucleoside-diphosphate-sugar epimerase
VTGASGRLGRWVLPELIRRGHTVEAVSRNPPEVSPAGTTWRRLDLRDRDGISQALVGCDAVIHLGAIPSPERHTPAEIFDNNVGGTFSVLSAAEAQGISRLVVAGSVSAIGGAWAQPRWAPDYAPVDEQHPLRPEDPYGLTKLLDEHLAQWFGRRHPAASVVVLRLHWILEPDELAEAAKAIRGDPASMAHLLWGYVDVRDAADACISAAERSPSGYNVATITAADTLSDEPTELLLRRFAPGSVLVREIPGRATGWSLDSAFRTFGYEPRHSWRDPT